jgi:probable rRNA maturation factor
MKFGFLKNQGFLGQKGGEGDKQPDCVLLLAEMEINVLIDGQLKGKLKVSWLKKIIEQVLIVQGAGANIELGLVITNQEKVKQLNRDYRGRDEPTDVLAFSAGEEVEAAFPPFIQPPDGVLHLGEVIISYPQAIIQAEEYQHSIEKEVAILIIHGVLHLLGYEHDKPGLARQMKAREAELLSHIAEGLD